MNHLQDMVMEAWNEAEELSCSLRELTDGELIDCRESLLLRARTIMAITDALEERLENE